MTKKNYDVINAIERLKKYCVLQDKCKWDASQKMQTWKLNKKTQQNILELLIKEKYIDEERYAKSFCRGKFKIKKWGKLKIISALKRKYISVENINIGIKEINKNEYLETLENLYQKKKKSTRIINTHIKNKRIAEFLINKGYESNLVWNKIKKLSE